MANLVNFGIVPLVFSNPEDYDSIDMDDDIEMRIGDLVDDLILYNKTKEKKIKLKHSLSLLDIEILMSGGKLPWIKKSMFGGK
jgi:aconitate hydratase